MDEVTWGALTLTLTLLGGAYTWFAFRRRGAVAGLRGVGLTLLPLALLLTDTLQMVTRIGAAVGDWALGLAFSPVTWLGILLVVASVACFVVAGFLADRRGGGVAGAPPQAARGQGAAAGGALPSGGRSGEPVLTGTDPEMAEIEALLRKRGIQ